MKTQYQYIKNLEAAALAFAAAYASPNRSMQERHEAICDASENLQEAAAEYVHQTEET